MLGAATLGTAASLAMNLGSDERRRPPRRRTGTSASGAERAPFNIGHGKEDDEVVRSWRERRRGGGICGSELARVSRGCFVVGLGCSVGCLVYTLGCKFSKKNNWAAKRATELDRAETGSARSPNESNIHSSARPISMSGRAESGRAGASFGPS